MGSARERLTGAAIAAALTVALTGCRSPLGKPVAEARLADGEGYTLVRGLEAPKARGPAGCGAQALATVYVSLDPDADPQAESEALPWHEVGATPVELLLAARARGHQAVLSKGDWDSLHSEVARGRTPIVMLDASRQVWAPWGWFDTGNRLYHWGVVSGVGAGEKQRVLLAAEGGRHHVMTRDLFEKRWSRTAHCMIVVSANPPREQAATTRPSK
jgi:ABC-type bacteriocin/lantibiotic exporter with double-glycine peptidase domain